MVIAAPPIQADSRRKGRNRRLRPSGERGKGVHGAMGRSTMTNRRKRWLRRFAIGVSIAAFAAPAAAKPTPAGGGGGVALQQSAILRPDDRSDRFTVGQQLLLASAAVRPDDRADRFAISDGASSATSSQQRKRFLGWGRDASDSARSCSSWPSASGSATSAGPKSPESKFAGAAKRSGLFGARFRLVLRALSGSRASSRSSKRTRSSSPVVSTSS